MGLRWKICMHSPVRWQTDGKGGANIQLAVESDTAAVCVSGPPGDGESQSSAGDAPDIAGPVE